MTNRFLISVAAVALIAGTGFANAQGAGGANKEGAGSTVQHSAPAPGGAAQSAPQRGDAAASEKAGASESKSMGAGKQAEDNLKGKKPQQNTASDSAKPGKDMKAEGRDSKSGTVGQAPAEHKGGATTEKSGATTEKSTQGGQDRMNRDDKMGQDKTGQKGSTTDTNRAQTSPQGGEKPTTGAVTSTRAAAPPPEKQTQIVSAIRQETSIKETTNVNFNITVGAVVPTSVHFYPLPARIVEIYPEWRGYQVILVKGRYVIIRPQTHEIVYIIEG
jgi:hypothetical protein